MATVIEVGANTGEDTERLLDGDRNTVYAFEPSPDLIIKLHARFKGRENFYLVPMAADLEEGWRWFNVADNDLAGISSLYELRDDIGKVLPGVTDYSGRYRVMTARLDNFIKANGLTKIDYLWIDAQGNDFRVLQSLGDCIDLVSDGKCEATFESDLYEGADNHYLKIAALLQARGFDVAAVPTGGFAEADVHFRRRFR
jgi:FkbM family methyltransferase